MEVVDATFLRKLWFARGRNFLLTLGYGCGRSVSNPNYRLLCQRVGARIECYVRVVR